MMTPTAAKELWCPMRKMEGGYLNAQLCIAEKCAMWRWLPNEKFLKEPEQIGLRQIAGVRAPPETGYCGLAGRQEVCS